MADGIKYTIMNKRIIILTITLLFIVSNIYAQTTGSHSINTKIDSTEAIFGKNVFNAFKDNNVTVFENLYPTNEEYKALLQLMLKAKVKGLTQQKIDEVMERRKREASDTIKRRFAEFQAQADSAGIVWSNAIYQSYDWQEIYPEEIHQKYLYGTIWFSVDGVRYMIEDVQAVALPVGYKLQQIYRIRKAEDTN